MGEKCYVIQYSHNTQSIDKPEKRRGLTSARLPLEEMSLPQESSSILLYRLLFQKASSKRRKAP